MSVYLFDIWKTRPVYHAYGRIRGDADVTVCGLTMYDTQTRYSARLQEKQARLFARPCGKCFDVRL